MSNKSVSILLFFEKLYNKSYFKIASYTLIYRIYILPIVVCGNGHRSKDDNCSDYYKNLFNSLHSLYSLNPCARNLISLPSGVTRYAPVLSRVI